MRVVEKMRVIRSRQMSDANDTLVRGKQMIKDGEDLLRLADLEFQAVKDWDRLIELALEMEEDDE